MTDDEIIAVVQAHKEGKAIQTRSHFHPLEGWQTCNPIWDFYQNEYRVAPEPRKSREWHVHVIRGSSVFGDCEMLTSFPADQSTVKETIRVREVIE